MRKLVKTVSLAIAFIMLVCSVNITALAADSEYKYEYTNWYARSVHRYMEKGSPTGYYMPATYLLKNGSEEFPAYCVDLSVNANKGSKYKRLNLEDVTYFKNKTDSAKVRAIVNNGFWPDDVSNTLAALRKATNKSSLTAAEALAGTQLAIWEYGNSGTTVISSYYAASRVISSSSLGTYQSKVGNTASEHGDLNSNGYSATTNSNIMAVRSYLLNLAPQYQTTDDVIINNAHFVSGSNLTSSDGSDVNGYEVTLTFNLASTSVGGNLTLTATQNGKTVYNDSLSKVPCNNNTYTLTFKTYDLTKDIKLSLKGTQNLPNSVYFYQTKQVSDSQSFVGKGSGSTDVNASATISMKDVKVAPHKYKETITKEPTCTEKGEKTYICENDSTHTYTEEIAAKGHTPVTDKTVEPTCTEKGLTEGSHCSECKEVLTPQKEIAAKGHTPVIDEAVESTCTEKGLTEGSHCSECKEILVPQEETAEKEHKFKEVVTKEPTCTEKGEKTYVCENDETHTYTEEIEEKGHTVVVDEAVESTCTEKGLTEGSHCSECKEILVPQEETAEKEHKFKEVITKAPTCTEKGVKTYICENDSTHTYTEVIAEKGHTIIIDNAVQATSKEDGLTEGSHCSECKEIIVKQEVVPAVESAAVETTTEEITEETTEKITEETAEKTTEKTTVKKSNSKKSPETGYDNSTSYAAALFSVLSGFGIIACIKLRKRKNYNND